jgi:hypothetical protein
MGKNSNTVEEHQGKGKKTREDRATYRKEVDAEKTQRNTGHEDEDESLDLPTPLSKPHDARKPNTYVISVPSFLHFSSPTTMLQLTETTLFHSDLAFEFLSHRFYNAKKDFSGPQTVMKIQTWMEKMQPRSRSDGGSSTGFATTIANTELTTSSGSRAPMISSNSGLGYRHSSDVEAGDSGVYRNALVNLPTPGQQIRGS